MADIRIKDLAVTASSSASDDYLAVDGSTNGTRKLSAYSPTFGGNLTVSGTVGTGKITVSSANLRLSNSYYLTGNLVAGTEIPLIGRNSSDKVAIDPDGYGTSIGGSLTVSGGSIVNGAGTGVYYFGTPSNNYMYYDGSSLYTRVGGSDRLTISGSTGNVLIGTNTDLGQKLQVSGTAAISGAISIGNTVQTAVAVASTHKVTISIGGTTYYLLATNV